MGFVLNLLLWFAYLVFFTKDDSIAKIWNVLKLRGTFGYPKEISLRWSILILQIVFSLIFFKPNFFANINALSSKLIYDGNTMIYEDVIDKRSSDKRFKNVYIKIGEEKILLEGNTFEVNKILAKKVNLKVYDGLFFRYGLVKINHK